MNLKEETFYVVPESLHNDLVKKAYSKEDLIRVNAMQPQNSSIRNAPRNSDT